MTMPIELEAREVRYGSRFDEDSFFGWLNKIPAVISYEGQGRSLYIQCDPAPIDDACLRELLSLFHRYGVDTVQLDVYLTDANRSWFANKHAYWRQPRKFFPLEPALDFKVPEQEDMTPEHAAYVQDTLAEHLRLGRDKPISLLPIKTIERVMAMSVAAYRSMVEAKGLKCVEVFAESCWMVGGAVYAYHDEALRSLLAEHREHLSAHGWPVDPEGFIRRSSAAWLDEDDPAMEAVCRAFGD